MSQERYENLVPPEGGFELYRYKNAEKMRTSGWSGWALACAVACRFGELSQQPT